MNIKPLQWDSEFFGIRIARIDVDYGEKESDVKRTISENECNYDLIYIFGDGNLELKQDEKCKLVDVKVVYAGELDAELGNSSGVEEYMNDYPCKQLYNLSYTSGKYSRYKTDCRFKDGDYERLYGKWIENSVNKSFADKVLCYYDGHNVERGMVTIKFTEGKCIIGLIAVDEECQSQGVGKKLMAAVKKEMFSRNINLLEVATQKDNQIACSFYERCGLKVDKVSNVYHYWCKNV